MSFDAVGVVECRTSGVRGDGAIMNARLKVHLKFAQQIMKRSAPKFSMIMRSLTFNGPVPSRNRRWLRQLRVRNFSGNSRTTCRFKPAGQAIDEAFGIP